jgi:hypothetical protein
MEDQIDHGLLPGSMGVVPVSFFWP